ncbi:hypothetical protein [Thermococcus piezophilus]|uniref:hypothetical protein n=1 Tax=Thermococcus piezophilus TaxID=1712654 RepID=UPI001F354415|nr:hypothetical protein [Thermococcus piezophilus]
MLPATVVVLVLLLDIIAMRIEIDDRKIRIRGTLGLIMRKTIPLENIASFKVGDSWMKCYGRVHFALPARCYVVIIPRKGWSVSFSTNRPEEIAKILSILGIPREP